MAVVRVIALHTNLLAEVSNGLVILIEDNADLIHQSNLFFIVTVKLCGARIDVWEKSQNAFSRNRLSLSDSRRGRHLGGSRNICGREMPQSKTSATSFSRIALMLIESPTKGTRGLG